MTEPERRVRSTTGDLLHLVEELSHFDRIGVTRLARHLGVPVPTAYQMLRALERAGYVEQLAESKEYRLTLKLFEGGSRVARRTTLRDLAAVEVEHLAQQARLAANVSVFVDGDVLYLAQVKTEDLLAVNLTRTGYAVDRSELNLGVWCVAALILGVRQTQPAAVSVSRLPPPPGRGRGRAPGQARHHRRQRITDRLGSLGNMTSW